MWDRDIESKRGCAGINRRTHPSVLSKLKAVDTLGMFRSGVLFTAHLA